jgi:hypothetical protein
LADKAPQWIAGGQEKEQSKLEAEMVLGICLI